MNGVQTTTTSPIESISPKSRLAATILCGALGMFGAHRFYTGKIGTGIAMIILFVGGYFVLGSIGLFISSIALLVWVIVDFIKIVTGSFKDKQGLVLAKW